MVVSAGTLPGAVRGFLRFCETVTAKALNHRVLQVKRHTVLAGQMRGKRLSHPGNFAAVQVKKFPAALAAHVKFCLRRVFQILKDSGRRSVRNKAAHGAFGSEFFERPVDRGNPDGASLFREIRRDVIHRQILSGMRFETFKHQRALARGITRRARHKAPFN